MTSPLNAAWLKSRLSVLQIEEGNDLVPLFDDQGLVPAVTTDAVSGEVLMMGFMNAEALLRSIETGEAHYWSRSRRVIWHKGASSGFVQTIFEMRVDDDQDAIWMRIQMPEGAGSCHVGYRSCFYRAVPIQLSIGDRLELQLREDAKLFDPAIVYAGHGNPTRV
jgi:phosphoribosyl-AMP cyclohydrolase